MVSATMAVEQNGCNGLNTLSPTSDKIPLDLGTMKCIKSKEELNPADDYTPKARKPYTITKQRERWTEEEHKKFIEALKLYGRAWRKIEEHVGSKTAVQIRSHAQKFFSKVVRESTTCDSSSVKSIEIPPPRPKRKPMHPYPRKLVSPVKTGIIIPEKPTMSASPNTSEQDNQSPTSVLSALGSDSSVGPDSTMPNGSTSSASSALAPNDSTICGSEMPKCLSEGIISSSHDHEDENLSPAEQVPMGLELLSPSDTFDKDQNQSVPQSLKLFGKTLLVTDHSGPSDTNMEICNPEHFDPNEGTCSIPCRVVPLKFPTRASDYGWNAFSNKSKAPVYNSNIKSSNRPCAQMTSDELNPLNGCHMVPFPWLTLCSNASHPTPELHSPTPVKAQLLHCRKEKDDPDEQKEGSSTGSSTDLFRASKGKRWDTDSSTLLFDRKGKEEVSFSSYKLNKRVSSHTLNCKKGFMPYKRCFSEQDSTVSSAKIAEDMEKQRIRLCL